MVVEASITGLFRTLLLIIGAFVVLRFLGQLMNAKRSMEEERRMNEHQRNIDKERKSKLQNFGKTKIISHDQSHKSQVEDVDFEEVG